MLQSARTTYAIPAEAIADSALEHDPQKGTGRFETAMLQ